MALPLLRLKELGALLGCDVEGDGSFAILDVAPGSHVMGSPESEKRGFQRLMAALVRLPGLFARVRAIERRLGLRASFDEVRRP